MKVKCKTCGKRFDYEMYYGICPKCGAYYGSLQTLHEAFEVEENPTIQTETAYTPAGQQVKENKRPAKSKSFFKRHALTIVLILLMVIAPFITQWFVTKSNAEIYQERQNLTLPQPTDILANKPFTFRGEMDTYQITVKSAEVVKDDDFNFPDELEMIAVSYSIEAADKESSNFYSDTNTTTDNSLRDLKPYLLTKSGYYLEPISSYRIRDKKDYSYNDAIDNGVSDYFEYKNGKFYFLVKKDDVSGFLINLQKESEEVPNEFTLQAAYSLKNLEVTK